MLNTPESLFDDFNPDSHVHVGASRLSSLDNKNNTKTTKIRAGRKKVGSVYTIPYSTKTNHEQCGSTAFLVHHERWEAF